MAAPTMSRDGKARMTLRVDFRIDGDDLAYVLANELDLPAALRELTAADVAFGLDRRAREWTKKRILEAARDRLHDDGLERLWTVVESYGGQHLVRAAARRIRELFPDLPPTTTTLEA